MSVSTAVGTRVIAFPFMERPVIGALLAATAGSLNAWSLAQSGTFATVQSGNVIVAGVSVAAGQTDRLVMALLSIVCFGAGAFVNSMVVTLLLRRGRAYSGPVLLAESAVIAAAATCAAFGLVAAAVVVLAISFVAGSQGNAFHRDRGMLYGNVAVTFVVQSFFSLLGRVLIPASPAGRRADGRTALIFGGVLLAFAGGAALGFLADSVLPAGALWLATAVTLVVAGAALTQRDPAAVDPSQNAPTP